VAVASAGPYASLHLAPDRQSMPAPQYPTTQFFTGWMPFLPPIQQRQSTDTHKQKCNLVKEVGIGCIKPLLLNVKSHK